jgi:hypothetical protein
MKLENILEEMRSPWHGELTDKSKIYLCKVSIFVIFLDPRAE